MLFESWFQLGQPDEIIPHIGAGGLALMLPMRPGDNVIRDPHKSDKRIPPTSARGRVVQRLTSRAVPFLDP
jgi:hypothetical protein